MQIYSSLRAKPLLRILQGYSPETTMGREAVYPIHSTITPANIKSGMVVSLLAEDSGALAWVIGLVSGQTAHIALRDGDEPFVAAVDGMLPAISMAGQYTFETGYFDEDEYASMINGAALSAYANDDGTAANRGKFFLATEGDPVIARILPGQLARNVNNVSQIGLPEDSQASDGRVIVAQSAQTGVLQPAA